MRIRFGVKSIMLLLPLWGIKMDFISWALALIGINSDRAARRKDQQAQAFRLAAEVSNEAGRAMDIMALAMPRLSRRCAQVCSDSPEICSSMMAVLNEQQDAALKIISMAEDYKTQIAASGNRIDWDNAILQLQEWRATASRIAPWVESLIKRYDEILYEAGAR